MNINPAEIPSGSDYQWVTAVCGDRSLGQVDEMKATGWRTVPASRHPALAKRSVNGTSIEIGGLLLMERPKMLTAGAVAWESEKARAQSTVGHHVYVKRRRTLWERFTKARWTAWVQCRTYLRHTIVTAAPTCTLWVWGSPGVMHFRPWPPWQITKRELLDMP